MYQQSWCLMSTSTRFSHMLYRMVGSKLPSLAKSKLSSEFKRYPPSLSFYLTVNSSPAHPSAQPFHTNTIKVIFSSLISTPIFPLHGSMSPMMSATLLFSYSFTGSTCLSFPSPPWRIPSSPLRDFGTSSFSHFFVLALLDLNTTSHGN